jgi:FkbM family methyltransferase
MLGKLLNSRRAERIRRFLGVKSGVYLKLKRFTSSTSEEMRTATILKTVGVDLVLDVGANTGQFGESLFDFGYKGKLVSFEPVSKVHKELQKRAGKYETWEIADRCAIGNEDSETTINICEETVFSSLLKIKSKHVEQKKSARIISEEKVDVKRMDSVAPMYIADAKKIVLKVDTQGFEKQVLEGAVETLEKIVGLKIEIPLQPIYDGVEFTFYDIIDVLKKMDFEPYSFGIEGVDLKTGRINTIDGLFFKKGLVY